MKTHLSTYVALVHHSEKALAESLRIVGEGHAEHPDVLFTCQALAAMSLEHVERLKPMAQRYGEDSGGSVTEPERLHAAGLAEVRTGPVGLLRDLQDLHMLATLTQTTWTVIGQGAQGLRDDDLLALSKDALTGTARQLAWFVTRMKAAAPQALVIAR
ncbi:hypothetical protein LWF15_31225 [Kineosporia rhizophila]|uniref:hypothetical protein n=1 Tax=Kineosporia rhizophila TaxID=84633 RepID=UPI000A800D5C|nr:hypothetical protein [Kineosporia rhizophila]MCE0539977.1 hypothetical protein [Kineosporia rhizophila]